VFHFRGLHRSLETILLFSQQYWPAAGVRSHHELKTAYNKHLATIQPGFTTTQLPRVEMVTDEDLAEKLAHLYEDEDDENLLTEEMLRKAKEKHDGPEIAFQRKLLEDTLIALRTGNPRLGALFDLAINRLFFFPFEAAAGGSHSRCIGVIWANPDRSWTLPDAMEFCIHELTHNLFFLEEMVNPLYRDFLALQAPENFAISAIRRSPRRLDLVVHSLFVGIEILLARSRWLGQPATSVLHPSSSKLAQDCRATLRSIQAIPDWQSLFLPNGLALLEEATQVLESAGMS
jgi:hypothetical protein